MSSCRYSCSTTPCRMKNFTQQGEVTKVAHATLYHVLRVEGFGRNTAGECAFTMWKRLCLWKNYFCKPPFNRTCKRYSTDFTFSSNNKSHAILSNLILIIQIWLNRSICKQSFYWHWHLVT